MGTLHGPVLTKRYRNELMGAPFISTTTSHVQGSQINQNNPERTSQIRGSNSEIRNSGINNVLGCTSFNKFRLNSDVQRKPDERWSPQMHNHIRPSQPF